MYTVRWKRTALDLLTDLWIQSDNRSEFNDAVEEIDRLLARQPYDYSESRSDSIRVLRDLSDLHFDQIPREVFDLRSRTLQERYDNVEKLINKEIAHAATPESRKGLNYQGTIWGNLYEFHGELCKTAHFLDELISETGMNSFLPVFQGDEFRYLSRPIVAENDLQKLANRWAELRAEYESWKKWHPCPAPRDEPDVDESHE